MKCDGARPCLAVALTGALSTMTELKKGERASVTKVTCSHIGFMLDVVGWYSDLVYVILLLFFILTGNPENQLLDVGIDGCNGNSLVKAEVPV